MVQNQDDVPDLRPLRRHHHLLDLHHHPEEDSVVLEDAARVAKVDGAASQRIIARVIARGSGAQAT